MSTIQLWESLDGNHTISMENEAPRLLCKEKSSISDFHRRSKLLEIGHCMKCLEWIGWSNRELDNHLHGFMCLSRDEHRNPHLKVKM